MRAEHCKRLSARDGIACSNCFGPYTFQALWDRSSRRYVGTNTPLHSILHGPEEQMRVLIVDDAQRWYDAVRWTDEVRDEHAKLLWHSLEDLMGYGERNLRIIILATHLVTFERPLIKFQPSGYLAERDYLLTQEELANLRLRWQLAHSLPLTDGTVRIALSRS